MAGVLHEVAGLRRRRCVAAAGGADLRAALAGQRRRRPGPRRTRSGRSSRSRRPARDVFVRYGTPSWRQRREHRLLVLEVGPRPGVRAAAAGSSAHLDGDGVGGGVAVGDVARRTSPGVAGDRRTASWAAERRVGRARRRSASGGRRRSGRRRRGAGGGRRPGDGGDRRATTAARSRRRRSATAWRRAVASGASCQSVAWWPTHPTYGGASATGLCSAGRNLSSRNCNVQLERHLFDDPAVIRRHLRDRSATVVRATPVVAIAARLVAVATTATGRRAPGPRSSPSCSPAGAGTPLPRARRTSSTPALGGRTRRRPRRSAPPSPPASARSSWSRRGADRRPTLHPTRRPRRQRPLGRRAR